MWSNFLLREEYKKDFMKDINPRITCNDGTNALCAIAEQFPMEDGEMGH